MGLGRRLGPLGACDDELVYWHGLGFLHTHGKTHAGPIGVGSDVTPSLPAQALDYNVLYKDIQNWEGVVKFMYLDTAKPPKVTVGTGNMLPDVAAAQALPFMNTATGKPATKDEIATAFKAVAAMHGSMVASKYKQKLSIEVTEEWAKKHALERLKKEFVPKLQRHFKGFDKYPFPARQALIDMAYNMGIGKPAKVVEGKKHRATGLTAFEPLKRAVEAGDWTAAAAHCKRANPHNNPHTAARNDWTKSLFERAGELAARHERGALHAHPGTR